MTVLLFITTIALFLTIDYFVRRNKKTILAAQPIPVRTVHMRTPAGIFFTKSHTWLSLFPSGKVQLGIDDFVARMFNRPEIEMLKSNGDTIKKGDAILRLKQDEKEVIVRSPIEGVIERANMQLSKKPELLTEALFSEGWAYTITPSRTNDLRAFYLGNDTRVWLKEEMGRLRDFFAHMSAPVPVYLQDGGDIAPGVFKNLNKEQWKQFENQFLRVD
jgi:glycine cleavage system H protein